MKKKYNYDWFGQKVKQKKKKDTISFLGLTPQKNKVVSFLGGPTKYKMTPSPLFKKEKINQKKFSKWGDADMDGSPNYFDCDPAHFLKDGKLETLFGQVTEIVTGRGISPGKVAKQKAEKAEKEYGVQEGAAQKRKAEIEGKIALQREYVARLKAEGENLTKGEMKEIRKQEQQARKMGTKIEKGLEKRREFITQLKAVPETYERQMAALKLGGPKGIVKLKEMGIQAKLAAGKVPTQKELIGYKTALEKTTIKARAKRFAKAMGIGGVTGLVTGEGLTRTGTYGREMLARGARVRRITKAAAGLLLGPSLTVRGFASEPRGRGRPAGPSGEYKIGGKPVYEEEFRQWEAKQNALNRMLPSEAQSQTLNPEYLEYMKARELEKKRQEAQLRFQQQTQMAKQQVQMPQEGEMIMEDGEEVINEPVPSDQSPITEGLTNEEIQAMAEAKIRPYTRAGPDEIKEAQHMAQKRDQILNAPNFMKGELKAAGGSILTPTGPQIMDAPNVFTGEMRNVTSDGNMPAVRLSERPQTNPYGSEFLEIEIGSGKPVVRRRITEKWMSGEAL